MNRYRIKIEEKNNGEKWYTPEVGVEKTERRIDGNTDILWKNITKEVIQGEFEVFSLSQTQSLKFPREEQALEVIQGFKKKIAFDEEQKVKSITYKEIE